MDEMMAGQVRRTGDSGRGVHWLQLHWFQRVNRDRPFLNAWVPDKPYVLYLYQLTTEAT